MPSGTPVLPGGSNTYVKTLDASGRLVVGFSRNPKEFALNQYVQLRDVNKDSGFYLRITTEEAGRVIDANLADFVWPDGADRPQANDGTETFAFHDYKTQRYDFNYVLGRKSHQQADWNIAESHQKMKAQQAMTARAVKVHSVLSNAANWEADHTSAVAAIAGNAGPWDASTNTRVDIQRSLEHAANVIRKSTLGVVRKRDLVLVMNPETARKIAVCQEIRDHIKQSPFAMGNLRQDSPAWSEVGLPSELYGYKVVIEDAVKVTSRRGAATATREDVMEDGVAYLLSRPGGLVAPDGGGPSFSTMSLFLYEDMTVEEKDDTDNRRLEGHVVDDHAAVLTASASGFRFTGVLT